MIFFSVFHLFFPLVVVVVGGGGGALVANSYSLARSPLRSVGGYHWYDMVLKHA